MSLLQHSLYSYNIASQIDCDVVAGQLQYICHKLSFQVYASYMQHMSIDYSVACIS